MNKGVVEVWKPWETYLGTGRAVAHMATPVQDGLSVHNTHAIFEQGRLCTALIPRALVSPFD